MTMRSLIDKLKDRPKTVAEYRAEQRDEWKRAVESLFLEIERWLAPAVNDRVLVITRSEVTISEQDLGEYQAPVLEISDGQLTVRLEPVGTRVVGVVSSGGARHIGLRGRIDLTCGPIRIPIVRNTAGEWKSLPLRGEPRELTEESFAEILGEVLLDE
jgi:hypothetical protein